MGILGWSMFAGETRLVGMMLTNRRRCQLLQLHDAPLTRHPSANDRTEWVWSPESNCLLLKRVNKHSNLLAIHAWMLTPTSMEWNERKNVKVINISHQIGHTPAHFHPFPNSQLLEEFQASSSVSTRELSRRPKKNGAQISTSTPSMVDHVPEECEQKTSFPGPKCNMKSQRPSSNDNWNWEAPKSSREVGRVHTNKWRKLHLMWKENPIRREISGATDPLDVWWKHRWPREIRLLSTKKTDLCWTNSSNHSKLSLRE